MIKAFALKKMLGLDALSVPILKAYYNKSHLIYNYCALIDIQNIRDTTDNTKDENITKALLIGRLLNELGYRNLMDGSMISDINLDIGLEKLKLGLFKTEQSDIKKLFNMTKLVVKLDTRKAILGFINVLFKNFNIQISSVRKWSNDRRTSYFFIDHQNYIKEILTYKMEKRFKLFDSNQLFIAVKQFELQDLYIKPDIMKIDDTQEMINQENLLDFGLNIEIE
jgi:hypothetical protein